MSPDPAPTSKSGDVTPEVFSDPRIRELQKSYWRKNLWFMFALMLVWAAAGLGCGVLWADHLNQYYLLGSGIPLGFWFAQQGSIIVFVFLILIYCIGMNHLDKQHHQDLLQLKEGAQ